MTAQLVEKNTTPLEKVPVDSVTLDIIENALKNARFDKKTGPETSPEIFFPGIKIPGVVFAEQNTISVPQSACPPVHSKNISKQKLILDQALLLTVSVFLQLIPLVLKNLNHHLIHSKNLELL